MKLYPGKFTKIVFLFRLRKKCLNTVSYTFRNFIPLLFDFFYVSGMIISMPFLLMTFLVYVILSDTAIHKRALMFYVLTLLLAYICLVSVQICGSLNKAIGDFACPMLGKLFLYILPTQ